MKTSLNYKTLLLSGILSAGISSISAADLHVVYPHYSWITAENEYYGDYCLPKTERLKSYAGDIFVDYDESLPLEIRTCARLAVDIWEPEIRTSVPVRLKVVYAPLDSPEDATLTVTADVAFKYDEEHDTAYPSSLYRQLKNEDYDDYDAVITINSNIPATDWSYTVVPPASAYSIGEKYSLTTSVMRAIGNALGIGSGIDYSGELPSLALPALTPYDRLITFGSDSELSLDDLGLEMNQTSEELAELLTNEPKIFADSRYVLTLEKGKAIDTPAINFARNYQYLYGAEAGIGTPYSDSYLKKILTEIGWDTERPPIGISQRYTPSDSGILVSGYYDFYDNKNFSIISSKNLYIDFICKDGSMLHKSLDFPRFTLPDDSELELIECNVNGDIYGYIAGTLTTRDMETQISKTTPIKYRLSIPQPPAINGIKILPYQDTRRYILVTYQGAESIGVRITDSNGNSSSEVLEMPYNAIIPLGMLDPAGKYTISLIVGNNKGVCQEEIFINGDDISIGLAGISDVSDDDASEWDRMEVYDLNGRPVATDTDDLPKGIYIVVYYNGSSPVKRDKIII